MNEETVIRVKGVKKSFRQYKNNWQKIQHLLLMRDVGRRKWLFNGVSFEIKRGEKVGIIGMPFSGRTTLMRMICGVLQPDSGKIEVNGEITPILDHKLGFQTPLTGLENYQTRCSILGWTKEEIEEREEKILEYAGISKEKDQPIKSYMAGKVNRLGFAISTETKPEILVYDAGFNFGSNNFVEKAVKRLNKLTKDDETTLIMTASRRKIASMLCERGIVFEKGKIVFDGPFNEAMDFFDANVKGPRKENADQTEGAEPNQEVEPNEDLVLGAELEPNGDIEMGSDLEPSGEMELNGDIELSNDMESNEDLKEIQQDKDTGDPF